MASLTPGVLLKLLQHASDRSTKVTGEHRSALLQVLEIIPSLATGDDPWRSKGFFLKVSDSLHSAYVSISDEDLDLIFSDKIQLGQFLHVSRLDSASPVHVLRGIKPVPKRRPCVGNPTDLVSSDWLSIRPNVDILAGFQGSEKVRKSVKKDGLKTTKVKRSPELEDNSTSRRASLGSNARVEGLELRRMSVDSPRRGWDQSPMSKISSALRSSSSLKPKDPTSFSDSALVLSDKKASTISNSVRKHHSLINTPPSNKNNDLSLKVPRSPLRKDLKSKEGNSPRQLVKVPVSSKSLSEQNILWESLPSRLHALGKDAFCYRNAAFVAAVDALQESSAAECVIRCMSMFSELCDSNLQDSRSLVQQFLNLHQNMQQASTVVNALLAMRSQEGKTSSSSGHIATPEACKNSTVKALDATSWVQAALDTNLSKFSLFVKQDGKETPYNEKLYYIALENSSSASAKGVNLKSPSPQEKQSSKIHGSLSEVSTKKVPPRMRPAAKTKNAEKEKWSQESGLKETASLAKRLLLLSRGWFLKYLEDSLSNGFGLKRGKEDDGITGLLGQLKRVNQWLEDAVCDDIKVNERIESLKKKLYGFLLEHVDAGVLHSRQGMS